MIDARPPLTENLYTFEEVVDLSCAKKIAKDLAHFIRISSEPCLNAYRLRQAGLPLMQLLVSARRYAEAEGKTLRIEAPEGGNLLTLLNTFGLDPDLCATEIGPSCPDRTHKLQPRGSQQ